MLSGNGWDVKIALGMGSGNHFSHGRENIMILNGKKYKATAKQNNMTGSQYLDHHHTQLSHSGPQEPRACGVLGGGASKGGDLPNLSLSITG